VTGKKWTVKHQGHLFPKVLFWNKRKQKTGGSWVNPGSPGKQLLKQRLGDRLFFRYKLF